MPGFAELPAACGVLPDEVMRSGAPVLALVTCLTLGACGASRTPGRVAGGIITALGGAMAYASATTDTTRDNFGDALSAGIQADMGALLGGMIVVGGLAALVANELRSTEQHAEPAAPPPPPIARVVRTIPGGDRLPEPPTADGRLHQLTLQASLAARAGQCSAVRVIADRVDDLDTSYRRGGFVADAAIAGCL